MDSVRRGSVVTLGRHRQIDGDDHVHTEPLERHWWAWRASCELVTRPGPLLIALEETTYLTVVCPLLPLPEFLVSFAASVGAELDILGVPRAAAELNEMPHVHHEPAFPNQAVRLLFSAAASAEPGRAVEHGLQPTAASAIMSRCG